MQYQFLIIYLLNIIIKVYLENLQYQNSRLYHLSSSECFHQESIDCPQIENPKICPCKTIKLLSHRVSQRVGVYCCNLNSETLIPFLECANFLTNITDVHIRNATIETLNVGEVTWKNLKSLSITDGRINNIEGQFLNDTTIDCLNLSNNALFGFENNFIAHMNNLENLDLSHNNISYLPTLSKNLAILDISGISNMSCSEIKDITDINENDSRQLSFRNRETTTCHLAENWAWFKDDIKKKISIDQLFPNISNISECPKGENWQCKCKSNKVLKLTPSYTTLRTVTVDCSNNSLTELPKKLPSYTSDLIITNNKVTKLDYIVTNPSYQYLQSLYADYNEISSINILEGSHFINNFNYISLRHNKLKSIPTHILVPIVYKASDEVNGNIYLGGNKILCDCYSARYLKNWLERNIVDGKDIYCSNSIDRVVDLDVIKMCKFDNDLTDYVYCIIAIEVILLFTIVSKLLFDYWHYKKSRKLPWLSKIMPKTYFDRLCEIYL